MKALQLSLVALVVVLGSQPAAAQEVLNYRAYSLNSSIETVVSTSGARPDDIKVLHQSPALIQELEWRAPYARSSEPADPVRQIMFFFCDNALYQVLVSYDTGRTEGLSNSEIIESLTAAYGAPVPGSARNRPLDAPADTVVLAQWDRAGSSLTLFRKIYSAEFQLLLTAKALGTRARGAIREAERHDIATAPQRERDQRKKELADAAAALDKIRISNKAAFRP